MMLDSLGNKLHENDNQKKRKLMKTIKKGKVAYA